MKMVLLSRATGSVSSGNLVPRVLSLPRGSRVSRKDPGNEVVPVAACRPLRSQPRSQGLSSLPPLVVGRKTLVAAGHMTTQNLGGKKIC